MNQEIIISSISGSGKTEEELGEVKVTMNFSDNKDESPNKHCDWAQFVES